MSLRDRALVEILEHHLRSPLTVIVGHAELLVDQGHDLPVEVERSLRTIRRAGGRLSEVVAGTCDLIDAACTDPATRREVDVSALVLAGVTARRDQAARRDIRLLVTDSAMATCRADPDRLRRALDELLANAITHTPERSTVEVAVSVVAGAVRIEVSDDGAGVEPAEQQRVVEPFERGTNCSPRALGLGTGLAIVAAVAAAHGGRLTLAQSAAGGLAARIELPADSSRPGAALGG